MKHYEVCSPTMLIGRSSYPPDPGEHLACFAYVEAETPAKAKAAALRLDEFGAWRDNCDNPFTGLTVRLSRCEHGVCTCDACYSVTPCPACEAAFEAEQEANQ